MSRPTDDELEAMAARLEMYSFVSCKKAAAMLRACKTADAPDHAVWNAAIEAAAMVAQSYGCCHVPQEIAEEIRALKKGQTNE